MLNTLRQVCRLFLDRWHCLRAHSRLHILYLLRDISLYHLLFAYEQLAAITSTPDMHPTVPLPALER